MKPIIIIFSLVFFIWFGCKKEEDIVLPKDFLTVSSEVDNSVADGNQYNKIAVTFADPAYIDEVTSVTASANSGTLLGTPLTFDESGKGYIYLKSSQAGTIDIVITAMERNFHHPSHFSQQGSILTITTLKDLAPADDNEYNQLLVALPSGSPNLISSITVATTLGTLLSNAVNFDINGNGYVYLKSAQIGTANITITAQDKNYNRTLIFTRSYPTTLNINVAASLSNKMTEKLPVAISLKKPVGKVSPNTSVVITALDKLGQAIGSFFNFTTSDTDGNVTGEYWLQDTNYTGFVKFNAAVLRAPGDTVCKGSNRVLVYKPKE